VTSGFGLHLVAALFLVSALVSSLQVSLFPANGPVPTLDGRLVFAPACGGVDDTAAFELLIETIDVRAGALMLPASRSRCAVGSLTIPANVSLDNTTGAGLKINDGSVLTILGDIDNASTRPLFFNTGDAKGRVTLEGNQKVKVIYPQWFGAVADGVTSDLAAVRAAVDALPSPGHLHFPAGAYWLGAATTSARLAITKNEITITGDGIQRTILKYDSDVPKIDGRFGPGSALLIGETSRPHFGYVLEDFSIEDVQPRSRWTGAHNPSAVDAYKVDRVRIERVEAINIKGNSAFYVFSPSPQGRDLIFRDNIVRGTAAGGFVQGVGLNWASFSNAVIENNHIEGVGLGGIGAGACGACKDIRIVNNVIDYLDRAPGSAALILTGDGDGITVTGNTIRNFAGGQKAIQIGSEDGGKNYPIRNVVISNNIIEASRRSADRGIALTGNWQLVAIRGNRIRATYPIDFESGGAELGSLEIAGNVFDSLSIGPALAKAPATVPIGASIFIHDNTVTGDDEPLKLVDFANFPRWRAPNIRFENNTIGTRVEQQRNHQIDGVGYKPAGDGGVIAARRSGADFKTTIFGAMPGDRVEIALPATFPQGVAAAGTVTAANEVTWHLVNNTTDDMTLPPWPTNFVTIRVIPR
jgi:hypothetical protein